MSAPSPADDPIDAQLSAFLDGELSEAERAAMEARLAREPALRAELDALRDAARFVRLNGPAPAPDGFHARVMAEIASEPMPVTLPWWHRPLGIPLAGWAVAAMALLVVGIPMSARLGEGDPVDEAATEVAAPAAPSPARRAAPRADRAARMFPVPFRYTLVLSGEADADALVEVAERHGGTATPSGDGRSWSVALPSTAISAFARDLDALGEVEAHPDGSVYGGPDVRVRVDVVAP